MTTWYVRELSKLSNVSVRTLHYYDKIGLLHPSGRLSNGYRVYSQSDLIKLQKIIALKFFGFTLSHIRLFLQKKTDFVKLLRAQLDIIHTEASYLQNTQKDLLSKVIEEYETENEVNWASVVQYIDQYAKAKEINKRHLEELLLDDGVLPENREPSQADDEIMNVRENKKFDRDAL